jgi:hypothetical protein
VLAQVKDETAKKIRKKRIAAKCGDGDAPNSGGDTTHKSTVKKMGVTKDESSACCQNDEDGRGGKYG